MNSCMKCIRMNTIPCTSECKTVCMNKYWWSSSNPNHTPSATMTLTNKILDEWTINNKQAQWASLVKSSGVQLLEFHFMLNFRGKNCTFHLTTLDWLNTMHCHWISQLRINKEHPSIYLTIGSHHFWQRAVYTCLEFSSWTSDRSMSC